MTRDARHRATIEDLARRLEPMRRLGPPGRRTGGWGAVVAALATGLAAVADLSDLAGRIRAMPEIGLMLAGSALTAVAAAAAAVLTGLPDRGPRWAVLALPPAAIWFGAGAVAAFNGPAMGRDPATLPASAACLTFILGVAVPIALVLCEVVRRSHPLSPHLTGALVGLAAAAAAATLVALFHPYRPSLADLAVHVAAVLLITGVAAAAGRRLLTEPRSGESLVAAPGPGRAGLD
ncbi:NrsF family protein [Methylobacterium sp. ID0610]|uniref:NrsF family protein n=1 Tax=Methylobacterium carpenticola TaxID=3344827 RepID=UPI0036CC2168